MESKHKIYVTISARESHEICLKWESMTNTLIQGITPHGQLLVLKPDEMEIRNNNA
jgi:hypothetical protein